MDKFVKKDLPRNINNQEKDSEYITIKFEAATDKRSGNASIGYSITVKGNKYLGFRNIGNWSYNEALALAVLDALECAALNQTFKVRLLHRGLQFQLYFVKGCDVPTRIADILAEVRKQLNNFKAFTIKLIDKKEFKKERSLAKRGLYHASQDRILTQDN